MKKYKVRFMMDENYEVIEIVESEDYSLKKYSTYNDDETGTETSVYQGRLSDCESWIRLNEKGYFG